MHHTSHYMHSNIFINIPVKDLSASVEFWKKMGYKFNTQFTDDTAACLVLGKNLYAMLLTYNKMKEFMDQEIVDPSISRECLTALSCDSREAVDLLLEKAKVAGAEEYKQATDHGFMYTRSFDDLDGHRWELLWMDPAFIQ